MVNANIAGLLNKFSTCRVLVIGDVMVDAYLWGKVSRISPEAPVPVVTCTNTEYRPGGAANVALNLHSLGAEPVVCAVTGKDREAGIFKEMLGKLGISHEGIVESDDRCTTLKTRIIAGNQQLLRVDREDDKYIVGELEQQLWERIRLIADSGPLHAIVFQDYDKGVITPFLIEKAIDLGNKREIPTLVDPKKRNFNLYRDATLFKPNFKELVEGLNLDIAKEDTVSLRRVLRDLQERRGFGSVLLTLSEQGLMVCQGERFLRVPTEARDIADVSGAGDTVIALASLCLAAGVDLYDMAKLVNLAAGMVCQKVGVVPVEKEWLLRATLST